MSKKNVLKIILMLFIIICIISLTNITNAATVSSGSVTGFVTNSSVTGSDTVIQIVASVLDVVRTIGAAVAVVILLVISGKYLMASAGDRADIKKYAFNYVVGAIILMSASGILSIIKEFVTKSL
ncbi:MAG: hypothetical protein IKL55_01025 [Clostridia bacterium]|nr:hypothetical protein [Clostridia bacterium]